MTPRGVANQSSPSLARLAVGWLLLLVSRLRSPSAVVKGRIEAELGEQFPCWAQVKRKARSTRVRPWSEASQRCTPSSRMA